jgi:hypothetical protein
VQYAFNSDLNEERGTSCRLEVLSLRIKDQYEMGCYYISK